MGDDELNVGGGTDDHEGGGAGTGCRNGEGEGYHDGYGGGAGDDEGLNINSNCGTVDDVWAVLRHMEAEHAEWMWGSASGREIRRPWRRSPRRVALDRMSTMGSAHGRDEVRSSAFVPEKKVLTALIW